MDKLTRDYRIGQLSKVGFNASIKITSDGGATNYLNITAAEFRSIYLILTAEATPCTPAQIERANGKGWDK